MGSKYIHEKESWEVTDDSDEKGIRHLNEIDREEARALFDDARKDKVYFKDGSGRSFKLTHTGGKYFIKRKS